MVTNIQTDISIGMYRIEVNLVTSWADSSGFIFKILTGRTCDGDIKMASRRWRFQDWEINNEANELWSIRVHNIAIGT
jgi:hypothetical protein